jgi:hypothetical protein
MSLGFALQSFVFCGSVIPWLQAFRQQKTASLQSFAYRLQHLAQFDIFSIFRLGFCSFCQAVS